MSLELLSEMVQFFMVQQIFNFPQKYIQFYLKKKKMCMNKEIKDHPKDT